MMAQEKATWDILESEADELYYIGDSEKPGLLLLNKYNPLTNGVFHLYMNYIARIISTRSEKEVRAILLEGLNSATSQIKVFKMVRRGRKKDKKILFGEFGHDSKETET